jgi:sugar-specific transcriptional regulator TrmB
MLSETLKLLGLTNKEAVVYETLLAAGTATAAQLARQTQLARPTVYDTLEALSRKGLMSRYKKRGVTYFQVLDPGQLYKYLENEHAELERKLEKQKKIVKEVLPQLKSLQYTRTTRPRVQFFEGVKGLREAYEDSLTCKDVMLAYTNVAEMLECLPGFFPDYFKRRAVAKIPIKAIFVDNPKSPTGVYVEIKTLLNSYVELPKEETAGFIAAWIRATYFHQLFYSLARRLQGCC